MRADDAVADAAVGDRWLARDADLPPLRYATYVSMLNYQGRPVKLLLPLRGCTHVAAGGLEPPLQGGTGFEWQVKESYAVTADMLPIDQSPAGISTSDLRGSSGARRQLQHSPQCS